MDRKEIQKERTRRYFLDAAKEIIRNEGMAKLTTKSIGEKAAYSYASIYNYFGNFNELACLCLEEMAIECAEWVRPRICGSSPRERILCVARLMIEANTRNPFEYAPFLSTELDYEYFKTRDGHHFIHPAYDVLLEELGALPGLGGSESGKTRMVADILTALFHSRLHFFLRYRSPETLELLHAQVRDECGFIIDKLP